MRKSAVFVISCLIGVFIQQVSCQTTITTQSATYTGTTNGNVLLYCTVQNKQASDIIVWEYITHNITIATGTDYRTDDGSLSKYEVVSPQTGTEFQQNLRINSLEQSDVGTYRCSVSNTTTKVDHHVVLEDSTSRPTAPAANILECCKKSNVDPCIYPLCNRANYSAMAFLQVLSNGSCVDDNIYDVLVCGQGGRNVLGCCIRSGISDFCQKLCEGWGVVDGTTYHQCIGPDAVKIATCYDEAIAYIPSRPISVTAVSSGNGFLVEWQQPLENVNEIVKYRVRYRRKGMETFDTRTTHDGAQLSLEVRNLVVDVVYEVNVIAVGNSGASQPSYSVEIAVKGGSTNQEITETIYDCCDSKGVSDACIGYCSADTLRKGGHPDSFLECFGELDKIYSCLANQGNHTPCCSRAQVPSDCFPLCEGRVNLNLNVTFCILYMNSISACIIEGSSFLPSPPFNTRIVPGSITDTSVTLSWQPPDDFKDGEDFFVVAWRLHKHTIEIDWNTVSIGVGYSYTIEGLKPAEIYDAIVATENKNGSSLPELTLVFVTEATGYDNHPPYNETACCVDAGVEGNCLDICDHDFRLTSGAVERAFSCLTAVVPMIQCASDGRDHTDCCTRSGVSNQCLPICSLHPDEVPEETLIPCLIYKDAFSICFNEGKGYLPNPPTGLTIKDIKEHSITLDWQRPSGPDVSHYTVKYSTEYGTSQLSKDSTETFITLESLMADTTYYFEVQSKNMNGTSLPSEVVVAYTLAVPITPNTTFDWNAVWQNRTECCSESGVSDPCRPGCKNGDLLNVTQCIGDLDKIIACGADGKDHSQCCSRTPNFPMACAPYCAGQIPQRDANTALCLAYKDVIFTCFTNGTGFLPSPPSLLNVNSYEHDKVVIKWEKPVENCENNCTYAVLLWQDGEEPIKANVTDRLTYTFFSLKSATEYRISVLAANMYGSSLPAPYIIVRTRADPFTGVTVAQYPDSIVNAGERVQLECTTSGGSSVVRWRSNRTNKIVSQSNLFVIGSLEVTDEGSYTCEATFNSGTKTKDLFLNVRYQPKADGMTEDKVLPGLDQEARIQCTFKGFPKTVTWSKDKEPLTNVSKYSIEPFEPDLDTGKSVAVLRIRSVTRADYGSYTCTGENSFGKDSITGDLQNLTPTSPIPPRGNQTVAECCDERGVPAICASKICTFTLDLNAIIYDQSLLPCLDYFNHFIECGTDGRDHSVCCSNKGVSEYCLDFCAGRLPEYESSWELITCMSHVGDIGDCLVDGKNFIPTAPLDMSVAVEYDQVSVKWSAPAQNADKVNKYDIYFLPTGSANPTIESVSASKTQYYLPVINKGTTYQVWGKAINNFGQSIISDKVSVTVTTLVPRSPHNFKAEVTNEVNIRITWEAPRQSNVKVAGYKVIFWKTTQGRATAAEAVVNNLQSTRLDSLTPNTFYSIVLVARSSDGYGQETGEIKVKTGSNGPLVTVSPEGYADDDQGKVGLAVGLTFAIIFLIAIAIVVVLFYRRKFQRKYPAPNRDAVAFENPQFGNQQRSGENAEDNQFGYGHLKEEQDHEQVHLSFGNTMSSSSTDTPATLDVTP